MNKAMLLKQYLMHTPKKGGRLPSAYQEVEWIKSDGYQVIDTGYIIQNANYFKVKTHFAEAEPITSGGGGVLFGSYPTTNNKIWVNIWNNGEFIWGDYNPLYINIANKDIKLEYYYQNIVVNGTTTSVSSTVANLSFKKTWIIFNSWASKTSTSFETGSKLKLYSYQMYYNDTLIRDFIPCYRKSDNEVGLYDLVNGVFYTNQGSGSFLSGPPIVNIDGYKQLTYIESDGNAYLNTGLTWDDGYRLNAIVSKKVSGDEAFCGVRTNSSDYTDGWNWKCEFLAINGSDVWQIAYNQSWLSTTSNKPQLNTYYNCECYLGKGEQYLIVDGNKIISDTISQIDNATIYNFMKKRKLFLFCRTGEYSDIDTVSTQFIGRCKYTKLTLNGVVVREYIPVERNDGVVGMYDLINNTFEASSGTDFIKGDYI